MTKPRVISLYSGAGGLDYGLEAAGFKTSVAVEMDPDCVATLRANRRWPVIDRDIERAPSQEILEIAGLKAREADVLVGGPPCQPFSKSGYWLRGDSLRLRDPRADTLRSYVRVLADALPRVFLLETVEGMGYRGKDEGLRFLLAMIEEINRSKRTHYDPIVVKINSASYGVPQIRHRLVVIGARDGRRMEIPRATHGDTGHRLGGMMPYRTAWDALAAVVPHPDEDLALSGRWADLLPSIPEGQNYLWHTDRMGGAPLFGWRRKYWSFLLKLAKDRPSWTIQAEPGPATGPFHWENRKLSILELRQLQTLPDDVVILGSRAAQHRQVGNAVPSLLAEVLGRQIRTQLLDLPGMTSPLRLLPPDRSPAPSAEPVRRVPKRYLDLAGKHKPHPGTGKGAGALARPKAVA